MAARGRPRSFDREAALAAAMKVFWQQGYSATSMADLYAAMGINSPSLYAAFGSKDDLYLEAIAHYEHVIAPQIWSPLGKAASAREAVRQWLKCSAKILTQDDFPPGCMVALSSVASEGNARLGAVVIRSRQWGIDILRGRLEQGVQKRELPAGTDTEALARLYVAIQQGISIQARDGASFAILDAVADSAMALWPA
ncbi:TetR/AcrR family transcriptional regulator [Acerihabitans sp. TG2]|uniref:TetR/AcrR family transcriptional regulator n=1 Tax=Acerihabitans sp. TG2 TaxID=3096008 RepID=UPI002B23CD0F|nr:TetR/AcrR family transcriptional regulator [Acerihabitans sp. TG2]MEA9391520.1 TetR/AcrR family transcriptional regulator [Acerihabitans sp. TG2]